MISSFKFTLGGARKYICFNPSDVKAAIVTCGGLCPGLNVVIRSIVDSLYHNYQVRDIYGIHWGFKGFYEDFPHHWEKLTPERVKGINWIGGSILGVSRGGFDAKKIVQAIKDKGIN